MALGDRIHQALALVGLTPEVASAWLGADCMCEEYRARLNRLDWAARNVLRSNLKAARDQLCRLLDGRPGKGSF